jgi:hypothetical protein
MGRKGHGRDALSLKKAAQELEFLWLMGTNDGTLVLVKKLKKVMNAWQFDVMFGWHVA